ncbi:MAG: radical SAM protein [Desulfobulbaceae bacterium]|nr:radical SAM protein [Desulfobulbaceae bacterium]
MDYQGMVIRPPSEAFSIILQVTLGCSHNACTFCGTYREKPFAVKPWAQIEADIDFAGKYCQRQHTLFLADGDVLALPHADLVRLLESIRLNVPWVRRVSSYASSRNIAAKTDEELCQYRELGLQRLYLGLESGHNPTLKAIAKGVDAAAMVEAARRIALADMALSVSCVLGIAGKEQSQAHALATAEVLNRMQPQYIGVLTLMLLENTPLYRLYKDGRFILPSQTKLLLELRTMVEHLDLPRCLFSANHSSNYLSLNGRLPKDRDEFLARIDEAIAGTTPLRSEYQRAL